MAIDPTNTNEDVVYAALYGNIVKSMDGGASWRTVLGQPNLLENLSGDLNNTDASFYINIMITPSGKLIGYLSTTSGAGDYQFNKGIFTSEDGENWEDITPTGFTTFSQRTVMSYAPSNEKVIYFLTQGEELQLWKLDGNTWSNRSHNIPDGSGTLEELDTQGSYNMTVNVHPSDENVVFIGGTNLYRSTDGFSTQNNITQIGGYHLENHTELYENHHPDQHDLVFSKTEDEMLCANDGGVYKTFDNQASEVSWVSLNNGYITSQFYTVAVSQKSGDQGIIGGLQDNGTYLKTEENHDSHWTQVIGGDGAYCATTPDNRYWYASFQNGNIFKLTYDEDRLTSWAKVDPEGVDTYDYLFVAPFRLDPNSYNRMYLAAGTSIWRNDNLHQIPGGNQVSTPINWIEIKGGSTKTSISALDVSTNVANRVVYGTSSGEIYKIEDASSVSPTPSLLFSQAGFVTSVAIDPSDAKQLLVAYSNYHIPSLFFSRDEGKTFVDVDGNLEQNPDGTGNGPSIRWCEIIPLQDGAYQYFVGTRTGLYSTDQLNGNETTWTLEGESSIGHAVVAMMDYRAVDGRLVIATHGNGIFQTTLANHRSFETAEEIAKLNIVHGFPNPFKEQTTIQLELPSDGEVDIYIANAMGKRIRTVLSAYHFAGEVAAVWDGTFASGSEVPKGVYFYVVDFKGKLTAGKLIKEW